MLIVAIARIPTEGVADYAAYEDRVLALLPAHGAKLERRLRTRDGTTEIHVLRFPSRSALQDYLADPLREQHRALLDASGAATEVLHMLDSV
jgi:uncharacterized protein (DUF1330 family)